MQLGRSSINIILLKYMPFRDHTAFHNFGLFDFINKIEQFNSIHFKGGNKENNMFSLISFQHIYRLFAFKNNFLCLKRKTKYKSQFNDEKLIYVLIKNT